jgi:hypothetical protein
MGPFSSIQPSLGTSPETQLTFISTTAHTPHLSFVSFPQETTFSPLNHVSHNPIRPPVQIHPTYTPVVLTPTSLSLTPPPLTAIPPPVPSSPRKSTRHSPRLSRFHPYAKPTSLTITLPIPLATNKTQAGSPSPILLPPKCKWIDDEIPLAVLKKK